MGNSKNNRHPDRGKIDLRDAREVQCWAKHLHVTKDTLQKAVDKVGMGRPRSGSNSPLAMVRRQAIFPSRRTSEIHRAPMEAATRAGRKNDGKIPKYRTRVHSGQ